MRFLYGPARKLPALAALSAACCVVALGQDTPEIATFRHEMTLPIMNIGFSGVPAIPPNVLQSIQGGALEIRHSAEYIPESGNLRIRHFLVAPGSPNPTPAAAQTNVFEDYLVRVSEVTSYTDPMSIVMMGAVERVNIGSPFGRLVANPLFYSFGYRTGTPTPMNNVTLIIPGKLALYGQTSSGTLTFGDDDDNGETPPEGPIADAGDDFSTVVSQFTLDGSNSEAEEEGETLDYEWRVVSGSANILDPNSVRPRVQLAPVFGDFVFELTVTDSEGRTSTDTVRVQYTGRF